MKRGKLGVERGEDGTEDGDGLSPDCARHKHEHGRHELLNPICEQEEPSKRDVARGQGVRRC